MKLIPVLASLAACWLSGVAVAQEAAPVSDALRSAEERLGRNLTAAAEEMPAAKYGFRPTKAQMSFGDVIAHLGQANDFLCGKLSGTDAPQRTQLKGTAGKKQLVARLKEAFDFCQSALANLDDSNLSGKVPFFGGREVTRAELTLIAVEDWSDHYSQLANYLRLNRLLPPTAKQKAAD